MIGKYKQTADIDAVNQIKDLSVGMSAMTERTSKTSAKVAKKAADNNHEEAEEPIEGRKRRRLSLWADRCENQGAE